MENHGALWYNSGEPQAEPRRCTEETEGWEIGLMKGFIQIGKKEKKGTGWIVLHFSLSLALFALFWLWFRTGASPGTGEKAYRLDLIVLLGYTAELYFFSRIYNAYLLGYYRSRLLVFAQFLTQFFSAAIVYVLMTLLWLRLTNPLPLMLLVLAQLALDFVWCTFANRYFFKVNPVRRTILFYRNELDKKRFGSIEGKPIERLYRIEKEYRYSGDDFREIRPLLEGYDAVFVSGLHPNCRNDIANYCKEEGIPGFFLPRVGDMIMRESSHIQSFETPVLHLHRKQLAMDYAIVKRAFDIVVSGAALVVLSPVMLVTALAIHFYDGGPALYKQVRLTQDGREYKILKFRSMRVDAEKDGVARLSTGDKDDRITPIGHFVRKCRLDELPQLVNILRGDMTIVGPRPERPEIAKQIYESLPEFRLRLQVKAGLTGYAQIYGRYNTGPYEKLMFDLLYISDMGIITDLMLMFATVSILFMSESTAGVEVGQTTAIDWKQGDGDDERSSVEADSHKTQV